MCPFDTNVEAVVQGATQQFLKSEVIQISYEVVKETRLQSAEACYKVDVKFIIRQFLKVFERGAVFCSKTRVLAVFHMSTV